MKADAGKGSALLMLTTKLFAMSEALDRWLIFEDDADPHRLWFFEMVKNEDAVLPHRENQTVQEGHNEVMALLA
jgi:quinol monooxygenase YgiN